MTQEEQKILELLWNKEWRLFSGKLYFIKDKYWKKVPFIPNEAQKTYYKNRHTKNIILKARQLGFSTFIDIDKLDDFLFTSYSNYWIIAQDIDSANFIFNEKVKFAFDNLPEWLKTQFKLNTDRKWEIKSENNQNSISVDTSFRWGTLQWLHISEYWKICNKYPEKAREIQTWALNTVAPTSRVDIESTAEWNSWYFFDMTMRAIELMEQEKELTDMDYKFHFFPWFLDKTYALESNDVIRTETIDYFNKLKQDSFIQKHYKDIEFTQWQMKWYQKKLEEQKDDMQREYPSFPKEAFDLAIKWAYYEKELSISDWINAVRDMFQNCYFNEETCFTWLSRLAWYRREFDEKNWIFRDKPKHDINSNGADAFRYLWVTYKSLTKIEEPQRIQIQGRYF